MPPKSTRVAVLLISNRFDSSVIISIKKLWVTSQGRLSSELIETSDFRCEPRESVELNKKESLFYSVCRPIIIMEEDQKT